MAESPSSPTATAAPSGAAPGYRSSATLPFGAEFRRQASRRRTQLALAFMVLLPLIILIAFPILALWLPSHM